MLFWGHRLSSPCKGQKILSDHNISVAYYKAIIENNETDGFQILFWRLLPYKVPIAVQTMLTLREDKEGRQINDIFNTSRSVRMEYMHVCVFPLENESVVLAFHHKRDRKYRCLRKQFYVASDDQNLKYINWLIFKYTENYFISKSIQTVIESDEKLRKLSQENNGFPNMGMVDIITLLKEYKPIGMEKIPNFLDMKYCLT